MAFVDHYLETWNAAEAARRAGYSDKTARSIGHENLTKPDIAAEIQRRVDERTLTANEVLVRLGEQARAEYSAYLMPEGMVDFARLIADGKGHLVKGIKETAQGRVIEFHDAQTALVTIGKHHKLWTDQVQHSGSLDTTVKGYVNVSPDSWDKNKNDG